MKPIDPTDTILFNTILESVCRSNVQSFCYDLL